MSLKVAHCLSSLEPSSGGPSRSVPGLAKALAKYGVTNEILSTANGQSGDKGRLTSVDIQVFSRTFPSRACGSRRLKKWLLNDRSFDIYHGHGIWELPVHYMEMAARKHGRPYLIAPRGMLEPWCLRYHRWKKRIALCLYQYRDLKNAVCLHATSHQEAGNFRVLGLKNPIAVIPNGVYVSNYYTSNSRFEIENKWKSLKGKQLLLFISRIHPKKGLLNLVKVWSKLFKSFPDWHLVIAGPDEDGHLAEVQRVISEFGAENQTTFTGPVYGDLKRQLYAACDCFVLPTFSENFGIVVAEALASGKPVITTKGTPWNELEAYNCGWYIDIGVESLEKALREALSLSDLHRQEMGQRGRKLVEENYSWPKIARQMIEVYKWILGQGDKPDCVRLY